MLRGRLGLETARIPHADRHGLLWLSRGALTVRDGTLRFQRDSPPDATSPMEEWGLRNPIPNTFHDPSRTGLHSEP